MDRVKISIVTICYNAVNGIEKTIQSVVNQTYDNIEYIIIDGGSSDGTVDIIKKYSDRVSYWVSERDGGIYDAMNKGLKVASGEYINFMNAGDCFVDETVLARLSTWFESGADVIYGDCFELNDKKSATPIYKNANEISVQNKKTPFCHQAAFANLAYSKEHPFDTSFRICADWNFFRKAMLEDGLRFQYVNMPVCYFDCNEGMSHDNLDLLYQERYRCLGIEDKPLKKFPYELLRIGVHIKRILFGWKSK